MRLYPRTREAFLHLGIYVALSVITVVPLRAADTAAELTGTVKDTSGAVVSNAALTLVNTATQQTLSQRAHGDGSYVFSGLSIGTYQLRVTANGFNTSVQDKITLSVNQHGRLDVTLKVSASE